MATIHNLESSEDCPAWRGSVRIPLPPNFVCAAAVMAGAFAAVGFHITVNVPQLARCKQKMPACSEGIEPTSEHLPSEMTNLLALDRLPFSTFHGLFYPPSSEPEPPSSSAFGTVDAAAEQDVCLTQKTTDAPATLPSATSPVGDRDAPNESNAEQATPTAVNKTSPPQPAPNRTRSETVQAVGVRTSALLESHPLKGMETAQGEIQPAQDSEEQVESNCGTGVDTSTYNKEALTTQEEKQTSRCVAEHVNNVAGSGESLKDLCCYCLLASKLVAAVVLSVLVLAACISTPLDFGVSPSPEYVSTYYLATFF